MARDYNAPKTIAPHEDLITNSYFFIISINASNAFYASLIIRADGSVEEVERGSVKEMES